MDDPLTKQLAGFDAWRLAFIGAESLARSDWPLCLGAGFGELRLARSSHLTSHLQIYRTIS